MHEPIKYELPVNLLAAVEEEFARAVASNGSFNSAHEGYAVLLEEVEELKAWVWRKRSERDLAAMTKECIQVAAMALRFITDVCLFEGRGWNERPEVPK